jgi:hypothetical protein
VQLQEVLLELQEVRREEEQPVQLGAQPVGVRPVQQQEVRPEAQLLQEVPPQ